MSKYTALCVVILGVIFTAIFWLWPHIDITVSSWFFVHPGDFVISYAKWANNIRHGLYVIVWTLGIALLANCLVAILFRGKSWWPWRVSLCLFLSIVISVGVVDNWFFKNHWGRPRPIHVEQFGGQRVFQKVWVVSEQCPTNCSFVCGDSSAVFAFYCFLPFIVRRRRRALWGALVTIGGGLIGLLRIAQGGHFLSDVLFSGVVTYLVCWVVYHLCNQWLCIYDGSKSA